MYAWKKDGRRISVSGLDHIKRFEGLRLNVYKDVAGYPTIGYGHLIKPGERYRSITEEQAEALLRDDVRFAENAVNRAVEVPLTQSQFDALVSFVYNVGAGAFNNSTLLRKLNAEDYNGATAELERWNKAGGIVISGLTNRREAEQQLMWS